MVRAPERCVREKRKPISLAADRTKNWNLEPKLGEQRLKPCQKPQASSNAGITFSGANTKDIHPSMIHQQPQSDPFPATLPTLHSIAHSIPPHPFTPNTETTPSPLTTTSDFASAPQRSAAAGELVRRGSDQALDALAYICTVTPMEPAVARYWPV